jgi:hypothetical protein
MHPFLLAFVDSKAFEFMMWALLIGMVLTAIFWFVVFFSGARYILQSWRQLRSAATQQDRSRAATRLLTPVVLVALWLLYRFGSTHYEAMRQDGLRAASQQIADSLRTATIGIYKLADSRHPKLLATTTNEMQRQKPGHTLADTAFVAKNATAPAVELILRGDSTFQYRSNIVGDGTGAIQQGRWKVECSFCSGTQPIYPTNITHYQPYFYTEKHRPGDYEGTSTLIAFYEKSKLRFTGSCFQRGRFMRFELKKVDSKVTSAGR